MTARDFVDAFSASVAARRSRGPFTPTGILDVWAQFVTSVTDGYDDSVYDYDNELSTRQLLEELSQDPNLMAYPEAAWFRDSLAATDEQLRAVLSDRAVRLLGEAWWWSHLPTLAGAELATDLRELYGFEVERVV